MDGEDGGEDGFDFVEGEDGAGEEGLQEGAVAVVVCIFLVGHGGGGELEERRSRMGIAEIIAWIACPWRVLNPRRRDASRFKLKGIAYLEDAWRSIEFDRIFCLFTTS